MRKIYLQFVFALAAWAAAFDGHSQSIHFSQYYNAPALISPANTALMPDNDFRLGANYRTQWTAIPVPYNTFSAFGDFKIGGNKNGDNSNWVGLGGAFFSDKAGDGNLQMISAQGALAYHMHISPTSLLSLGASGAYVQRSVNYDNLTFDAQWDGFTFNAHLPNGEKAGIARTSYSTVAAGINLSLFPSDVFYLKIGGALANINSPTESFYGTKNTLAMRPIGNVDMLIRTGDNFIVNPSAFYETQSAASELVAGSLFRYNLNRGRDSRASQLILGAFYRVTDAAIGVMGYQLGSVQFMASYDVTTSGLAPYNGSYGALEFSVIYNGNYANHEGIRRMFTCPRF